MIDWISVTSASKPRPWIVVAVWLNIPNRYTGPATAWWDNINRRWTVVFADDDTIAQYVTQWAYINSPKEQEEL